MYVTKMTVRVPKALLTRARQYAQGNNTTLTKRITTYLDQLAIDDDPLANAPIVRRLSGSLSQEVTIDDYHQHLVNKHGISNEDSD